MEMNRAQLDALCEIGNIGSAHAATALSVLLGQRIDMSVPKVWTVPLEMAAEIMGAPDVAQVIVYVQVEGDAPGKAVFFFSLESAELVAQILFCSTEPIDISSNELALSALKEVGNILVSSFLIALTRFSGIPLYPSVPSIAVDMVGAALEGILLEEGSADEQVLVIDTQLSGEAKLTGKFLFLPDEGSLAKMLGALGL